jgi:hypothetical protein
VVKFNVFVRSVLCNVFSFVLRCLSRISLAGMRKVGEQRIVVSRAADDGLCSSCFVE